LKAAKGAKGPASFIPVSYILFNPLVWKGFVKITQKGTVLVLIKTDENRYGHELSNVMETVEDQSTM